MLSEPSRNKTGPSRSHRVRSLIGPDRRRTLAYGSAYAPTTRSVRMQLAAPAVSSSSDDEVQPASCCWCRCRPAGVTAETTAVDQPLLQAYRLARGRRAVRSCASVIPVLLCTSARVIVVLPLPSVLNVFPSVEPTTIVNVYIQFAGFEQN